MLLERAGSFEPDDPPPALAVTQSIAPLIDPVFISDLHLALEAAGNATARSSVYAWPTRRVTSNRYLG